MRKSALLALFLVTIVLTVPLAGQSIPEESPPVVGRAFLGHFMTLGYADDLVRADDGSVVLGVGVEGGRLTMDCPPVVAEACVDAFGKVATFHGDLYSTGREMTAVTMTVDQQ